MSITSSATHGQPAASTPLLELRDVYKRFGSTRAVNGVSLDVQTGQVHCLLGENGAGKSTIGRIMAGLCTPDDGEILYRGSATPLRDVHAARSLGIAMVHQELSLVPHLSVRANLQLGLHRSANPFAPIAHRQETRVAADVLSRLALELDVETPVQALPVATQQLVEIGKALMQQPCLIIFDEPTAMLGAVEKQKLFEVIRSLRAQGTACILITHHIEDVMQVGDHVSIMRDGRLVDSFPMTPDIDAEHILERLTGRRPQRDPVAVRHESREPLLTIHNLPCTYSPEHRITIHRGEIVGLYGVVNCGAERITQGVVGLTRPVPLHLMLEGKPYHPRGTIDAYESGISYLPAGRAANGIFATRSVRENLTLTMLRHFSRYGVISGPAESQGTEELLRRFAVKYGHPEDSITSLSGGNQQKVLLARAMARAHKLLVLEEPTAGIDIQAKYEIHQRIRELAHSGVSVLLLSSDQLEVITLCDTVYTMFDGTVMNRYESPSLDDQASIISDVLGQSPALA